MILRAWWQFGNNYLRRLIWLRYAESVAEISVGGGRIFFKELKLKYEVVSQERDVSIGIEKKAFK